MNNDRISNIVMENARLIFKNFKGEATDYNRAGDRNFCVILDDETAEKLERDGWNVKYRKPREDDPDQYRQPYLKVKVKFGQYPPICQLINSKGKVKLTEETVDQLDWVPIENVDLIIRPYEYPPSNIAPEGGIAAYLKSIYVTIREDDLEMKYRDVPDLEEED